LHKSPVPHFVRVIKSENRVQFPGFFIEVVLQVLGCGASGLASEASAGEPTCHERFVYNGRIEDSELSGIY